MLSLLFVCFIFTIKNDLSFAQTTTVDGIDGSEVPAFFSGEYIIVRDHDKESRHIGNAQF
eukprot:Pgem_evm1s13673